MKIDGDERNPVDVLAEEFAERLRAGERPSIEEYASRHPDLASAIRSLFPTIVAIEKAKAPLSGEPLERESASGQRLGDFLLLGEIGRGGMGVVYEAEQESLKRRVALKVVSRASLLQPHQLERFKREARTAAQLHHTNIVPVFGLAEDSGLHYIVMQLIRGNGLNEVVAEIRRLRAGGDPGLDESTADTRPIATEADRASSEEVSQRDEKPVAGGTSTGGGFGPARPIVAAFPDGLPVEAIALQSRKVEYWQAVARIGLQIADAVAHAHSQRVLHRDIKPANIILDECGTPWITDFGLAKLDNQDTLTRTGDIIGTLQYIAPESLEGRYDARSDVYCLGLTLYELITLRSPYAETSPARILGDVARRQLPPPRRIDAAIPRDLETVILKAAAAEPDRRYQRAADLAEDLSAFVEGRPILARRAGALERLALWCRRNPAVSALSAAAIFLLVIVAVVATVGYLETSAALTVVSKQTRKAEDNLRLALDAFDQIFSQVGSAGFQELESWTTENDVSDTGLRFPPAVSEDLVNTLERLLSFYERFAANNADDPRLREEMVRAHLRVGDIQFRFGHYDEAESAYRRGLEADERLTLAESEMGTNTNWRDRVRILNGLGNLCQVTDRPADARRAHRRALELLQSLPVETRATAECRLELVRTHSALGRMWWRPRPSRPPPPPADEHPQLALDLAKVLAEEEPDNPEVRLALARAYRDLPPPPPQRNGLEAGPRENPAVARAIEILEKLIAEYPSTPEYHFELSQAQLLLFLRPPPGVHFADEEIEARLRKAIAIVEELDRHYPGMPQYAEALTRQRLVLADILIASKRATDAEEILARAGERLGELIRTHPQLLGTWRFYLAGVRLGQGRAKRLLGDPAGAVEILQESIKELAGYSRRGLRARRTRWMATRHYEALAEAFGDLGAIEDAARASEKARSMRPPRPPRRR